jgi:Trk K+ transport system NAD-binding subunit
VTEDTDLGIVSQIFSNRHYDEIAVVDSESPWKLVGSVHKRDVIHAYNQELLRRDLAGSVSSTVLAAGTGQQVNLGGGYVLQQILPPARFFAKTIRELDIGAATGVHVVLLHKRNPTDGRPSIRVPTAGDVIDEGDKLVVSGTKAAVEALDAI